MGETPKGLTLSEEEHSLRMPRGKSLASAIPECPPNHCLEASTGPLQIGDVDQNLGLEIFFSTKSLSSKLSFKTKFVIHT